jgi:Fe-S cluster assembly protein SufD
MENVIEFKEWFIKNFESFENSLNGGKSSEFHRQRKEALDSFSGLSLPTLKDEEWRYTNISPLFKYNFILPDRNIKLSNKAIDKFNLADKNSSLIVFVDGKYSKTNSSLKKLPKEVVVDSISEAIKNNSDIIKKHFGNYARADQHIFTALSTAYTKDGAFLYIPEGIVLDYPIQLLFITTTSDDKVITQPRNLIVVGKNSQLTVIERYASESDNVHFTNSVTEIVLEENVVVDHIKLQEENKNSFHIARMEVDQERNSNFSSHLFSTGSIISRNDFNSRFNDEGGECTLNGLYLIEDKQLFDAHTLIDHAKPNCNSHEHYKGILEDNSKGVFNGKVIVRPDAQKTNAFQQNNNILLSENANVNTKPQLEIFADDVKCSHGATIGQLDEEAKFYLKTRGIGEEEAMSILIHAFASDVIKSIKIESVRDYLENILTTRFNK